MASIQRAQRLRKKQTWAEKILWRLLRDRRFSGYKFRRQHVLGAYTLDFYCPEAKLVIETDGMGHGFPGHKERDAKRDAYLKSEGLAKKRIWNWQLRRELEWVRLQIWMLLQERAPHPGNVQPQTKRSDRRLYSGNLKEG